MVQIVAFLREKCRLKRLQTAFCLRFGQKPPGTALAFLYAPRRPAGLPLSLLQIGLRVQVGKMPVKFESDRPRPLLLQPAPQCFHPRKQIGNRALQNLRADVHNVVVHRYRCFHIKRVAQRCTFRHGFKPSYQIVRQVRHIARHNQQPIGRRQLQIVGCGTQGRKRAEMPLLPGIGKNVGAAAGVFFQVPVGTDGDMADLRPDFTDNVVNQRPAIQKGQPFVFPAHTAGEAACQNQCESF